MNKKILVILGVLLLAISGGVAYFILGSNSETNKVNNEVVENNVLDKEIDKEEVEKVPGDTNQLDGVAPGEVLTDPRGFAIDPFLVEFTAKLNEVNEYVFANLANFESGAEIDDIYKELWSYGESYGFRFSAVLNTQSVEAGDSEFTPQMTYFLNIITKDNIPYCAVDERVLNPDFDPNQALRQSVIASSCEEYLLKFKEIIDSENKTTESNTTNN
jgi:hypothetical protein